MLVLSRRSKEKIVFPQLGITVSVLKVRGNVVKLGIEAPEHTKILRHEVACRDDLAAVLRRACELDGEIDDGLKGDADTFSENRRWPASVGY